MDDATPRDQSSPRKSHRSPRTRSVLAATGILVIGLTPFAVAKSGDFLREGKRNGTTTKETEIISRIAASAGPKGGYSTRQSNLSSSGGGAIYGCRASSASTSDPCLRSNNLSSGRAFEFNSLKGLVAGVITVGSGGDTKKPFVTNATGVATGLNADRVDGRSAQEIVGEAQALNSFAHVTAGGSAGATRGVPSGGVTNPAGAGTYAVVFSGDQSRCALSATVTGADAGQATVTPTVAADKKTTAVAVRTFDGGGTAADRGFHLTAIC
ncbi:MAG: hypothetical protein M3401_10330 [Actinomycetota bacterium]|nr:hypothetical protein [Actinomycetota bacterium]